MKEWYKSKTLWLNVLAVVLFIVQYALDQQWLPIVAEGLIVGVANLILRAISGEVITIPLVRKKQE